MKPKLILAAALAAAFGALLAAPAAAQVALTPEATADIECMAATLVISQNSEEPLASQANAALLYFLGKVTVRGIDYTEPVEAALLAMSGEQLEAAAARCGAELEAIGDDMQRRGQEIQSRGPAEGAATE